MRPACPSMAADNRDKSDVIRANVEMTCRRVIKVIQLEQVAGKGYGTCNELAGLQTQRSRVRAALNNFRMDSLHLFRVQTTYPAPEELTGHVQGEIVECDISHDSDGVLSAMILVRRSCSRSCSSVDFTDTAMTPRSMQAHVRSVQARWLRLLILSRKAHRRSRYVEFFGPARVARRNGRRENSAGASGREQ